MGVGARGVTTMMLATLGVTTVVAVTPGEVAIVALMALVVVSSGDEEGVAAT
jgi:hypothetical protein